MVVAGGYDTTKLSTTEIYSVENNIWRLGTPLPQAINRPASLPYEESFLVLGGSGGGTTCLDTIYKVSLKDFGVCVLLGEM